MTKGGGLKVRHLVIVNSRVRRYHLVRVMEGDWGVVEVGRECFGILVCLGIVVSRGCGWACW